MSRATFWRWTLLGLAAFWTLVGFGACQANGQSLAEPQPFLERFGLTPQPASFELVSTAQVKALNNQENADTATGLAGQGTIVVSGEQTPHSMVWVSLHEWLHQTSSWAWPVEGLDYAFDREWMLLYEEGLVDAVTADLFPGFWRWHTGKKLRESITPGYEYWPYVRTWRAWSARATGGSWRTREAAEWRRVALTLRPAERLALVAG